MENPLSATQLFKRRSFAAATGVLMIALSTISPAGTASAATTKFMEANCLASSMVGDGCALWGTPHVVEIGRQATPIPQSVIDQASACAGDGLLALFEAWVSNEGPIPPPYKKLISGVYFFDGCVKGVTQANIKLNED